jgi:hypothetical protein
MHRLIFVKYNYFIIIKVCNLNSVYVFNKYIDCIVVLQDCSGYMEIALLTLCNHLKISAQIKDPSPFHISNYWQVAVTPDEIC